MATPTRRSTRDRRRVAAHAATPAPRRTRAPARGGAALPTAPQNGVNHSSHSAPLFPDGSNNHAKHAEIFNAALRLFQEKGYHGASMQDLADAVGMQKASLYYYFRSKEDLLVLVCERGTGAFTQELQEIVNSDLAASEKLRRAVECHLGALCAQLDLFTVFLHEQKFLGEAQKKRLRGEGNQHAELLAQILEEGIAAGEFRPVNVTVATLAILGMCNWLYEWYSPEGALSPSAIAAVYAELILNGLARPPKPARKGARGNSR
jgi:AcrR family transcriptional regulator